MELVLWGSFLVEDEVRTERQRIVPAYAEYGMCLCNPLVLNRVSCTYPFPCSDIDDMLYHILLFIQPFCRYSCVESHIQ